MSATFSKEHARRRRLLQALVTVSAAWACSPTAEGSAGVPGNAAAGAAGAGGGLAASSGGGPSGSSSGGDTVFLPGAGPSTLGSQGSCASQGYQRQLVPSSLLFLVDRSGSMNCNLPPITTSAACEQNPSAVDPTQPTKWSVIGGSMSGALDRLGQIGGVSMGLTFFSNDDACGVTSVPNVGLKPLDAPQVSALEGALASGSPRGGTPIVGATILAFKHLHEDAKAPGNRFVVLVTDGSDSCIDRYAAAGVQGDVMGRLLGTELPKALSVNIRTFVIGAPGSEPARGFLSKVAFAGGTPKDGACDHESADPAPGTACHFDMTQTSDFAKDLSDTLQKIAGQTAMSCEFEVPGSDGSTALDRSRVNVDYFKGGGTDPASKVELFRDDTRPCDGGADGWQYTPDGARIRLCGALCEQVRADSAANVVVSVGCAQRIR